MLHFSKQETDSRYHPLTHTYTITHLPHPTSTLFHTGSYHCTYQASWPACLWAPVSASHLTGITGLCCCVWRSVSSGDPDSSHSCSSTESWLQ